MNFDYVAKNYRDIHNENIKATGYSSSYFAERKIIEISRHIRSEDKIKRLNILDLGCGDGLVASFIRKYFQDSFISGIDISQESIQISQSRNITNSEFKVYDGKNIDYNEQVFDIILLAGILHHLGNQESIAGIIRECYRVLKPDGLLFIFEHNPYNPITRKLVKDCVFDQDAKLIAASRLKRILTGASFQSKFRFIIFFPGFIKNTESLESLMWWIPLGGQYYSISKKLLANK